MKRRVIVCLFLSIYFIYTHKNSLFRNIKELTDGVNDIYSMISKFNLDEKLILEQNEYSEFSDIYGEKIPVSTQQNQNQDVSLPLYAEKIHKAGYKFEEHKIQTEDGYILTAWRIPGKNLININFVKKNNEKNILKKKRPIMLQHGLFDSSYTWIMLNSTESLAFKLADEGHDVWITNNRGNGFSLEHIDPVEYDSNYFYSKFWDFTFHEMAIYDLPANVRYIKNITGWDKISYVGHSQGSVQYFIQYTQDPEFVENNIDKFVALGTVVNVFNTVSEYLI
jgi:hypothetical protein